MKRIPATYGLVLCEGSDDCAVFTEIAQTRNAENLEFEDLSGKSGLVARLKQIQAKPDFTKGAIRRLLITRDADESWAAAWQSLRDACQKVFDLEITEPAKWGRLNADCEVALWIAPGNQKNGMIETLCLEALKDTSNPNFECLDQFAECLRKHHDGTLHEKEKFAIWSLIAQDKSLPRQRLTLRRAIKHLHIDWKHPSFDQLSGLLAETADG
jgi:hypothetical protein